MLVTKKGPLRATVVFFNIYHDVLVLTRWLVQRRKGQGNQVLHNKTRIFHQKKEKTKTKTKTKTWPKNIVEGLEENPPVVISPVSAHHQ